MFADHQPIIAAHARTVDGFRRVCTFVLLTIRRPLYKVPGDMADVEAGDTRHVWGMKRAGIAALAGEGAARLMAAVDAALAEGDHVGALAAVAKVPGFGLAKGGFVLQLARGVGGCIDTHNLARFGYGERAFAVDAKRVKDATLRRHAARYMGAVDSLGGCESLWDSWCAYVAERQPDRYRDADHVSAYHLLALGLAQEGSK